MKIYETSHRIVIFGRIIIVDVSYIFIIYDKFIENIVVIYSQFIMRIILNRGYCE
jgi:hypothetical protein